MLHLPAHVDDGLLHLPSLDGHRAAVIGDGRDIEIRDTISAADARWLKTMLLAELPSHYDEMDASFPESIITGVRLSADPYGYFTRSKRVYALYIDGQAMAFSVASLKRGGAVKTGPTVVHPEHRRSGLATLLRDAVEAHLFESGLARKLYMTVSTSNRAALLFLLSRGFQVEGSLRDQYRLGATELVLGRFPPGRPTPRPSIAWMHFADAGAACRAGLWSEPDADTLGEYLLPRLAPAYDDVDRSFVASIIAACEPTRQSYARKGKSLIAVWSGRELAGVAVYVPKRGGAAKVSPLVADSPAALRAIVDACIDLGRSTGRHKLYTHVPAPQLGHYEVLDSMGFIVEAQLREAYKPGVDVVAMGRCL